MKIHSVVSHADMTSPLYVHFMNSVKRMHKNQSV